MERKQRREHNWQYYSHKRNNSKKGLKNDVCSLQSKQNCCFFRGQWWDTEFEKRFLSLELSKENLNNNFSIVPNQTLSLAFFLDDWFRFDFNVRIFSTKFHLVWFVTLISFWKQSKIERERINEINWTDKIWLARIFDWIIKRFRWNKNLIEETRESIDKKTIKSSHHNTIDNFDHCDWLEIIDLDPNRVFFDCRLREREREA